MGAHSEYIRRYRDIPGATSEAREEFGDRKNRWLKMQMCDLLGATDV